MILKSTVSILAAVTAVSAFATSKTVTVTKKVNTTITQAEYNGKHPTKTPSERHSGGEILVAYKNYVVPGDSSTYGINADRDDDAYGVCYILANGSIITRYDGVLPITMETSQLKDPTQTISQLKAQLVTANLDSATSTDDMEPEDDTMIARPESTTAAGGSDYFQVIEPARDATSGIATGQENALSLLVRNICNLDNMPDHAKYVVTK